MGSNVSYKLTIEPYHGHPEGLPDVIVEQTIWDLRLQWPEADCYLDARGRPSGNDGPWRSLLSDMTRFSTSFPDYLFVIEEHDWDYGEWARHYFQDGRTATLRPVLQWPDFDPRYLP